jgi:hypothetical protein
VVSDRIDVEFYRSRQAEEESNCSRVQQKNQAVVVSSCGIVQGSPS